MDSSIVASTVDSFHKELDLRNQQALLELNRQIEELNTLPLTQLPLYNDSMLESKQDLLLEDVIQDSLLVEQPPATLQASSPTKSNQFNLQEFSLQLDRDAAQRRLGNNYRQDPLDQKDTLYQLINSFENNDLKHIPSKEERQNQNSVAFETDPYTKSQKRTTIFNEDDKILTPTGFNSTAFDYSFNGHMTQDTDALFARAELTDDDSPLRFEKNWDNKNKSPNSIRNGGEAWKMASDDNNMNDSNRGHRFEIDQDPSISHISNFTMKLNAIERDIINDGIHSKAPAEYREFNSNSDIQKVHTGNRSNDRKYDIKHREYIDHENGFEENHKLSNQNRETYHSTHHKTDSEPVLRKTASGTLIPEHYEMKSLPSDENSRGIYIVRQLSSMRFVYYKKGSGNWKAKRV